MGEQKEHGNSWCHFTFNIVWGCQKVSEACKNCYAEAFSHRLGKDLWGPNTERQTMSESYWRQPLKWDKAAEKAGVRRRVFCSSMADVFEDHPTVNAERHKLFALIDQTPHLDWLLLTKRPENIRRLWPFGWYDEQFTWPNIWLGTTVENQEWADKRIPHLLEVPAKVRFLSCEPLLGSVNLNPYLNTKFMDSGCYSNHAKIDWVIVGGESGPHSRLTSIDWVRSIRSQCTIAGVPFHFKQHGEYIHEGQAPIGLKPRHKQGLRPLMESGQVATLDGVSFYWRVGKKLAGRLLDGRTWDELPVEG